MPWRLGPSTLWWVDCDHDLDEDHEVDYDDYENKIFALVS